MSERTAEANPNWREFKRRLEWRMLEMREGEHFTVQPSGGAPYAQVARDPSQFRAEVMSNTYLQPDCHGWSRNQVSDLLDIGWRMPRQNDRIAGIPGSARPNHWIDLPDTAAGRVAWMITCMFRDVLDVPDPDSISIPSQSGGRRTSGQDNPHATKQREERKERLAKAYERRLAIQAKAREVEQSDEVEQADEDPFAELDALIGLAPVRGEVAQLVAMQEADTLRKTQAYQSLPGRSISYSPEIQAPRRRRSRASSREWTSNLDSCRAGTWLKSHGAISSVRTSARPLPRVTDAVKRAMGGVLFIDEAYALLQGDSPRDYGHEAMATLIKLMEDHRDNLVVIMAGYPEPMQRLIAMNPGLASHFPTTLEFPDYGDDELLQILESQARSFGLNSVTGWVKPYGESFQHLAPSRSATADGRGI